MTKYLKNHFFRKTFIIYMLIIGVLIFSFFIVFFVQRDRAQNEKLQRECISEAEKMVRILDEKFNMIDQMEAGITNSRWRRYVGSNSDIVYSMLGYFDKQDICNQIATSQNLCTVASEAAVIFENKNLAIDKNSFWERERYFNSVDIDGKYQEEIEVYLNENIKTMKLIPMGTEDFIGTDFIVLKQLSNNMAARDYLFVKIDGGYFRSFIKSNLVDAVAVSIYVNEEHIYGAQIINGVENSTEIRLPSNLYPWDYVLTVVPNGAEAGIWNFYSILGSLLLGAIFVLFISWILARLTYQPIAQILKKYDWTEDGEYYGLERFEQIYNELQSEKNQLEELGLQYYQMGKNSCLRSLLLGTYDRKRILEYSNKFHLGINENMRFQVINFQIQDIELQSDFLDMMLKFQIECMRNEIIALIYNFEEENLLILGAEDDKITLIDQTERLNVYIDENCPEDEWEIYAGAIHRGLGGISISYKEALNKILKSKNSGKEFGYYFPFDEEIRMMNLMKNGKFMEVRGILSEIEMKNKERHVLPEVEQKIIGWIVNDFARFITDKGFALHVRSEQYYELVEIKNVAGLWEYLEKITLEIEHAYKKDDEVPSIGKYIVKYVDEHYMDSRLSQQEIADKFGIARSTVSKAFKETLKMNFVDYLHKKRVEHAEEFIAQGNFDVLKIAKECGYENEVTFKRAFVKHKGVTPREYVKKKRLES